MDMNRPVTEGVERPGSGSSRASSANSESKKNRSRLDDQTPGAEESKSRTEEREEAGEEGPSKQEQLIDENNGEGKIFEEAEKTDGIEESLNAENNLNTEPTDEEAAEAKETETGATEEEAVRDENATLEENNQTLNESESLLDTTNVESEAGHMEGTTGGEQQTSEADQEHEQPVAAATTTSHAVSESHEVVKEHEKKESDATFYHKKKKVRQQNRFADGNLIPEEDDNNQETQRIKSPFAEPTSQTIDHEPLDKSLLHVRHDHDMIATTPDKMDVTLDEDYQEVEVEVKPTREELIARFHSAIEDRERLQNVNTQLHHKLADYFRRKKSEDTQNQLMFEKSSQEQEQRYSKYLANIESLKKEMEREKIDTERKINELKYKCEVKEEMVEEERMKMTKFKKDTGLKAVYAQNGKKLTPKEVDFYLERERQKELDVISFRIENIKLNNQLKKSEEETKQKENTGETKLEMIDFEQLKIENQTYNEKIEERNEELLKLRKKINNTVQISSHVKEKLQYVMAENEKQRKRLEVNDEQVKKSRDVLNKIKQSKDSLRVDNARLKQKSGLLGNNVLLRDFEDCVDKTESLEGQIEYLKRRHAELTLDSKSLKQKINQVKAVDSSFN